MGLTIEKLTALLERKPGISCPQIGRDFGVSRQAVYGFFKRHPQLVHLRSREAGLHKSVTILKRALLEIADVGEELEREIATRALETL